MRILVHDFAGYSFPLQLSRALARRGHFVVHVYPEGLPGPKGAVDHGDDDPHTLSLKKIPLLSGFRKYSPIRRILTQRKYARDLAALIAEVKPDTVLSADTPIDVQAELLLFCKVRNITFVHWVQDIYCEAIRFFLKKKCKPLATLLSWPFKVLEMLTARWSDQIVVIAPAFENLHLKWGVNKEKLHTIENWAPLNEIPVSAGSSGWVIGDSRVPHRKTLVYSGTLGLKHRPDLIYKLAQATHELARIIVVSEGVGREYLERLPRLENLVFVDFQPYDQLPTVLGSADVLLAMLESDASEFAVPSKILSYLCAGKPILLAAPENNLAASVIERSESGIVTNPDIADHWVQAARRLIQNDDLRVELGENARKYAERWFDIDSIAETFEAIFIGSTSGPSADVKPVQDMAAGTRR